LPSLPVDTINAPSSITARIAITFVDVDFAVDAGCTWSADALVAVDAVLASTAELAGVALALVDLRLAELAGESREAVTREAVLTVDAGATVTGIGRAVVDVGLAGSAGESGRALARVPGYSVLADAAVLARRRGTVVDVDLAVGAGETVGARTSERVDEVAADATV